MLIASHLVSLSCLAWLLQGYQGIVLKRKPTCNSPLSFTLFWGCHCSHSGYSLTLDEPAGPSQTEFSMFYFYLLLLLLCILCSDFQELPGVPWVSPPPGLCVHHSSLQEHFAFSFLPDLLLLVLQDSALEKPLLNPSLKKPRDTIACSRSVFPPGSEGNSRL